MGNCFDRTDVFTASAEDYTPVGVDYGFLFTVNSFRFEGGRVAEVYAFAAGCAFGVVYFWVPGDFVSGDSLVFRFWHV